ncbi:MAG: hypothetical protein JW900_11530 [Anaerolineae bacterium]|nr:hypothetical protein [Anaerolineae bacterium]
MNEKLLYLYFRARNVLWPPEERWAESQAGLSKLAITVILVGVGVALTLAVVAILGPAILNLAQQTGSQIESVPMDWGP